MRATTSAGDVTASVWMSRTAMLAYLAETVHHARPAGGFDHKRECGHARLTKIDIRIASAKIDLSLTLARRAPAIPGTTAPPCSTQCMGRAVCHKSEGTTRASSPCSRPCNSSTAGQTSKQNHHCCGAGIKSMSARVNRTVGRPS